MHTEAAHIFPRKIISERRRDDDFDSDYASACWTIIERLAGVNLLVDEPNRNDFYRLSNLLTLHPKVRGPFDRLKLWFTPEDVPGKYKVHQNPSLRHTDNMAGVPPFVQWETDNPVERPLPDPHFVAIHASCAMVTHLSGAAEYIERVLDSRENQDTPVLASDGSMADYLCFRLVDVAVAG
ncbi:hypothetical protein OF83DRAFT_1175544 [Amylostereum chailletii]|nr:hypothetical protein OF83DRAFT_1175544 [Amylostereum chailletii]